MRSQTVRAFMVVSLAAALTSVTGVSGARAAPAPPPDDVITVASFDFAESRLLAEIYARRSTGPGSPCSAHSASGHANWSRPRCARDSSTWFPSTRGPRCSS